VYTAYHGKHAFVHALNTVDKFAVCIDMPEPAAHARDWRLRLAEADGTLWAVSRSAQIAAQINTTNFTVKLAKS
jgi:hypothetical protein